MIKESYNYIALGNRPFYYFESENTQGKQGKIPKAIIFTYLDEGFYNLAFGDLHKGDINDSVISNNHDVVKVISTVAKVAYDFSAQFPSRHIWIEPVDEKRKRLYNHVFRRNYEEISHTFHIMGNLNGKDEDYSPKKFYDIFKLKRKFVQ